MKENPDKFYKLTKNKSNNAFIKPRELRSMNPKNIIKSHLDISFIRNKFTSFKELIQYKISICLLLEPLLCFICFGNKEKNKEKEIKPLPLDFSFQNREWLSLGLCKVPNRNEILF